jgi:hypothetical protein
MSKGKKGKQATGAATTGAAQTGTGTTTAVVNTNQAVSPQVIVTVAQGKAFRGARAAWYTALCAHQGKPVAEFYENTAKKPPSLPKSGVAEKPSGWLSWFVRSGIATLS